MKIISVVGARPQFIKIAPLIKAWDKHNLEYRTQKIKHILVHTGQHYDLEMSHLFFQELSIPAPDYNLGVGSGSHSYQVGNMLINLEEVLLKEKPDVVLVYGDTNSTLAGALAAAKLQIPVGHIEAGLRSFNRKMPEEINRVLTDHISNYLFCPTKTAVSNLRKEGITKGVYLVGDVMYEIFAKSLSLLKDRGILSKLGLNSKEYFLLTIHRGENTDNARNLRSILTALRQIKERVVFPVHPRTRKVLKKLKWFSPRKFKNISFINPLSYFDMLTLEKNAKKILTDSGGVQKEAYWLKVPCITLRDETEWVETVKGGWNVLVGVDKEKIVATAEGFCPGNQKRLEIGRGMPSKRIADILRG